MGDKIPDINREEIFQKKNRVTRFDHKRNEEILEQLKLETFGEKLRRYESNWLRRITRMNGSRMTTIMLRL
jgi:hypothetical protein